MFSNKTILITGGTGSFGQKFVEVILKKYKPKKIIIYSRDELKQFHMQEKFKDNKNLRFFIGDVRDEKRLTLAMENVDFVVHSAALKHVPIIEYNPIEAIQTNVLGSQNVITAAIKSGVKKILALSTDKAAAPINLYGATKLASDKLFISANNLVGRRNTKFSVVRYGNVMGSRGSVIPHFINCKNKGFMPVTHPDMTRFNITLEEGVDFVIKSFSRMYGGELFIPKIPSYKVVDVAKAVSAKDKIKIVGIRPGEKIHEEMITTSDSLNTIEFKDYFAIISDARFGPMSKKDHIQKLKKMGGKITKKEFNYSSENNGNFLSIKQLQNLIKKNVAE
ncbi:UDP-N-acetylglucosamine 4,6-dehydratase (inverting) [Pelagibacteraceae bacterium]|nr:UDP-N-acetylglucosamine 4,6-dehydratase (inverting) [Pelagibacteraceae bacterium]